MYPNTTLAEEELAKYESYNKSRFQPQLKPTKTLGSFHEDGNPRDLPILAIGEVIKKGDNLPSGKNHANYIDKKGTYDIVGYMEHHKSMFRGLANVFVGQLAPHITTEVNCESLFIQAVHAAQPNHNRTVAETFEWLVMSKHCMARIYCFPEKVKRGFMRRKKDKDWNKNEDRDDIMFWDQQKRCTWRRT